jgi:hypothetical protein
MGFETKWGGFSIESEDAAYRLGLGRVDDERALVGVIAQGTLPPIHMPFFFEAAIPSCPTLGPGSVRFLVLREPFHGARGLTVRVGCGLQRCSAASASWR